MNRAALSFGLTVYKNILLLLGSNLGDRVANLLLAIKKINEQAGTVTAVSAIYHSAPWGKTNQPDFLNQVIALESQHRARLLLTKLLSIETELGRKRDGLWGPRIIDIDILFFGDEIVNEPDLVIPHPGIADRRFTLVPLCELVPDFVHPVLNKTCRELLETCGDSLNVNLYED